MKPTDLHKLWASPDNTRLTPKQASFRLPVHVAAKIAALAELFPQRNKTEIVGDLLAAALEDVKNSLPSTAGRLVTHKEEVGELFEDVGPRGQFLRQ